MKKFGPLMLALIGTLVILVSPVVALADGLFSGGITLLAGLCVAVIWKE